MYESLLEHPQLVKMGIELRSPGGMVKCTGKGNRPKVDEELQCMHSLGIITEHLPFGVNSASEIFRREMCILLRGHQDTVVVMDEHDRNLEAVLQTIKAKLNRDKCHFSKGELHYFWPIFSKDGIKPDEGKVKAITDMPSPTNIIALWQVLGMVNYLGKFLPDLSSELHQVT
ncbi:hypothetical protein AAFF_G00369670 [Aldrovandia affinis]|uniref:Reverse transcriptase n=1 Tax=Aldrovandia affinis TaxID=143900 RepID=A0AAD7R4Y4_9TELE|nr:hypothetical protein AAFF_G00369670 [Aldrovandia affinis]